MRKLLYILYTFLPFMIKRPKPIELNLDIKLKHLKDLETGMAVPKQRPKDKLKILRHEANENPESFVEALILYMDPDGSLQAEVAKEQAAFRAKENDTRVISREISHKLNIAAQKKYDKRFISWL